MSVSVVILAAGAGTRMRSDLPKILHKLSGRSIIDYPILASGSIGDDIQVVIYHQSDLVKNHLEKNFGFVKTKIQDVKNFSGTGGAIMASDPVHKRVVVLNGDMPLITEDFVKKLAASTSTAAISVFELDDPTGYGRVIIKDGFVKKIVEDKDSTEEEKRVKTVNAGVYSFDRDFLIGALKKLNSNNAQKEFYATDLIAIAVNEGKTVEAVYGDKTTLMGVNSKYELAVAESIHQEKIRADLMRSGVAMELPNTIFIDSRASFEGECFLENGVSIRGSSKIIRSTIKAHTIIEDSLVEDSSVGPLARVRPNSQIVSTHIGNFVEVKNSKLSGVKAGHLSYIGDSEIGNGTNIGAGFITCNYDGKNKHKTVIGKNVFVGSDSQIVAPVNIPDDVIIAAGTTVTKDPASGDLVISRTAQKSIAKFFYKFFGK